MDTNQKDISLDDLPAWEAELNTFILTVSWNPRTWPPHIEQLHRKICAAKFLIHAITKEDEAKQALTSAMSENAK